MREWWVNVYVRDGKTELGFRCAKRDTAVRRANSNAAYRIHVRLKHA